MKRALFVATVPTHIERFEKNDMFILDTMGCTPEIACNFQWESKETDVFQYTMKSLDELGYVQHQISFARSPFSKQTLIAYRELKELFKKEHYDVIHCHTPVAAILARLAARKSRKQGTKVIYTAHGFHFFNGAPLINWLIYYPAEKFCSYFTDVLITINQEDYTLAQKKMKAKKVCYIPGVGVDIDKFQPTEIDVEEKRKSLHLSKEDVVLLSVGELSKRKNHETIIRALSQLPQKNIHYLIAGIGELQQYLENVVMEMNMGNQVHFLGFRSDIADLCTIADVFCFPSTQEGLPVALMEAMGIGLPCVASNIRGNTDLITDGQGGFLVEPDDVLGFQQTIASLIDDKTKRVAFGQVNRNKARQFDVSQVSQRMKVIYDQTIEE